MEVIKQHAVLNLIKSGRYSLDPDTGNVLSNIGKEQRVMSGIKHYTGYVQYCLDIGYTHRIMVYGHVFAYLATWLETYDPKLVIDHIDNVKDNNKPDNLRTLTQKQNTEGNIKNRGKGSKYRLSADSKARIRGENKEGVSFVKLAEKWGISRQTIARICNVK